MTDSTRDFFDTLARILLRCWIFGFLLLLFSVGMFLLTGPFVDEIHGKLFGLSAHELDLIIYCGLGLVKFGVILLFLIPWLSIKLVLRKEKS